MFGVCEFGIELIDPGDFTHLDYQQAGWANPEAKGIRKEWESFASALSSAGALVRKVSIGNHNPDQVFAYDSFVLTRAGAIALRSAKVGRQGEALARQQEESPYQLIASITAPGTVDGGDVLWLSSDFVLIGHSWRTNRLGISQLRKLLSRCGVDSAVVDLPNQSGPDQCTHLMSYISMLGVRTALIARPLVSVSLVKILQERGIEMLSACLEEWDYLCTNVLSLGDKRLVVIENAVRTNHRLEAAGFELISITAPNLCLAGTGGPTCLSRAVPMALW